MGKLYTSGRLGGGLSVKFWLLTRCIQGNHCVDKMLAAVHFSLCWNLLKPLSDLELRGTSNFYTPTLLTNSVSWGFGLRITHLSVQNFCVQATVGTQPYYSISNKLS